MVGNEGQADVEAEDAVGPNDRPFTAAPKDPASHAGPIGCPAENRRRLAAAQRSTCAVSQVRDRAVGVRAILARDGRLRSYVLPFRSETLAVCQLLDPVIVARMSVA